MALAISKAIAAVGLVAAALGWALPAGAEGAPRSEDAERQFASPPQLFLERSYIVWGAPPTGPQGKDPWLIFEAGVAPHFFIYENLSDRLRSGVSGFALTIPFTFETVLRMFAVKSSPVRMPSYMPRIRVQLLYVWAPTEDDRRRRAKEQEPLRFRILGLTPGLNHHSNGQEGCRYEREVAGQVECVDSTISSDSAELPALLNRHGADFATNYLSLAADYRWGVLTDNDLIDHSWEVGLLAEVHPLGFLPGGMDRQTAETYGPLRVRARGEAAQALGRWNVREQLGTTVAFGGGREVFPATMWLESAATRPDRGGLGAFARLIYGRDYYNAFFVDKNFQIQLGLTFEQGGTIQFEPAAGAGAAQPPAGATSPVDPFAAP
jgi:hypothetical protein